MEVDVEAWLLLRIADDAAARTARRVMRALQGLKDCLLSGDDSGLANVWDEICVQVQSQESFYWDMYDETVRSLIEWELDKLPVTELCAVWLQTVAGCDWLADREGCANDIPWCPDDVVEYILGALYQLAEGWTNGRVRRYIDSAEGW